MQENIEFSLSNLQFYLKQGVHNKKYYEDFIEYLVASIPRVQDISFFENKWSAYHSWYFKIVKFSNHYHIFELDSHLNEVEGIDNAIFLLKAQYQICSHYKVKPQKCHLNDSILIDNDILEGTHINAEGIRLNNKPNSSSWVIVSEEWDGNYSSLNKISLSEFAEKRIDLLPLLFLPSGFRFLQEGRNYPAEYDESLFQLTNLYQYL